MDISGTSLDAEDLAEYQLNTGRSPPYAKLGRMKEERKGKRVERVGPDLYPVGEAEVRFLPLGQPVGTKGKHLRLSDSEADNPGQFEWSQKYTNNLYSGPTYPK